MVIILTLKKVLYINTFLYTIFSKLIKDYYILRYKIIKMIFFSQNRN